MKLTLPINFSDRQSVGQCGGIFRHLCAVLPKMKWRAFLFWRRIAALNFRAYAIYELRFDPLTEERTSEWFPAPDNNTDHANQLEYAWKFHRPSRLAEQKRLRDRENAARIAKNKYAAKRLRKLRLLRKLESAVKFEKLVQKMSLDYQPSETALYWKRQINQSENFHSALIENLIY